MPDNRLTMAAATDIITSRTKYHNQPRWTGTFLTSKLVPIYAKSNIRPGDTVKVNISQVIRGLKPIAPVMDDAFISVECFFAKHKHLLSRSYMSPSVNDSNHSFKAWLGAQDSYLNMPLPDNDIKLPHMFIGTRIHSTHPYVTGGLADCLKMPPCANLTGPDNNVYRVNCLKALAYYSIWNSYFREPNTQQPVTFTINSSNECVVTGLDANIPSGGTSYIGDLPLAGVCRDHGYFGSCLPWPQRNTDAITLPLGDIAPVYTGASENANPYNFNNAGAYSLKWRHANDWKHQDTAVGDLIGLSDSNTNNASILFNATGSSAAQDISGNSYGMAPSNLFADLSLATAATVNQVRYAFATQRWFEQLARSGNRYDELVYGMTGVRQSDSYDDRPEYLGGKKIPMSSSQVNGTSGDPTTADGIGQVGAFMHQADQDYYFTKSFDDYGTLMIVAFVRVKDTFAQGIDREDTVFSKFDIYWSQFANIGEVPVYEKEIYVVGERTNSSDNEIFGYQEAWADYRLQNDGVCGLVRPGQSLGYYTYANLFATKPTLKSFLTGSQVSNVDNTTAVKSAAAGYQWIGQFMFDMDFVRQVPMYSIPGYIDHH